MNQDFFTWAQSQPTYIISALYELYRNKPKGSELVAVEGTYIFKKISPRELKDFAKNVDNLYAKQDN